jgi:ABC-2 type transport system permease protein
MNMQRIKGVFLQEFFITKRSVETLFDIAVMPILSIIVFGFLAAYLAGSGNATASNYVMMGMLLWQTLFVMQYSITVPSLWNVWSRNLSNMFVTPLTLKEYIIAHTVTGSIKAIIILLLSSIAVYFFFGFNILSLGILPLLVIVLNLMLFGVALGIMLLGFIFRFGTKIQALAWGFLSVLQPLVAAFYPVQILPESLRYIALILPPTYIFEGARAVLANGTNKAYTDFGIAAAMSLVYLLIAAKIFSKLFKDSKKTGQFARNEG